jgi:hypothetical protein
MRATGKGVNLHAVLTISQMLSTLLAAQRITQQTVDEVQAFVAANQVLTGSLARSLAFMQARARTTNAHHAGPQARTHFTQTHTHANTRIGRGGARLLCGRSINLLLPLLLR